MNELLYDAVRDRKLDLVKTILRDNLLLNVNIRVGTWTPLHMACFNGDHEIAQLLLRHPQMDVNQVDNTKSSPLQLACSAGKINVAKLLLKDYRVNISLADWNDFTPLWISSHYGRLEVIRWMIALRAREFGAELETKAGVGKEMLTPIESARRAGNIEVVSLLERFKEDPSSTTHDIRLDLGLPDSQAAELFATLVFYSDEYLRVKNPEYFDSNQRHAVRLFNIAVKLPMELQMVLCYRLFGSRKQNIPSAASEGEFKSLTRKLLEDDAQKVLADQAFHLSVLEMKKMKAGLLVSSNSSTSISSSSAAAASSSSSTSSLASGSSQSYSSASMTKAFRSLFEKLRRS
jgi:hypothetical protein